MAFKIRQRGFTIVELMIAISVFSVAVVLITLGVMVISRQYQQSSTRIKLETANREIHQIITQAVQFTGGTPIYNDSLADWDAFCVGTQRFTFAKQPNAYDAPAYDALKAGLYLDTVPENTCPNPDVAGTLIGGGAGTATIADRDNLLPPGAKVVFFNYDNDSNQFSTKFVSSSSDLINLGTPDLISCINVIAGKEFCAVVQLTSSAIRRVNN
jgi:hypothetical protein